MDPDEVERREKQKQARKSRKLNLKKKQSCMTEKKESMEALNQDSSKRSPPEDLFPDQTEESFDKMEADMDQIKQDSHKKNPEANKVKKSSTTNTPEGLSVEESEPGGLKKRSPQNPYHIENLLSSLSKTPISPKTNFDLVLPFPAFSNQNNHSLFSMANLVHHSLMMSSYRHPNIHRHFTGVQNIPSPLSGNRNVLDFLKLCQRLSSGATPNG